MTPLQASAAQGTGHVAWQRGQGPFGADVCPWALTNGSPAIQGGDDHSLLMLVDVRWVVLWYVSLLGELKCCVSSVNSLR